MKQRNLIFDTSFFHLSRLLTRLDLASMLPLKLVSLFFLLSINTQYFLCDAASSTEWHLEVIAGKNIPNNTVEVELFGDKGNASHNISCENRSQKRQNFTFETDDIGSAKNISFTVFGDDKWNIEKIYITNLNTQEVRKAYRGGSLIAYVFAKLDIVKKGITFTSSTTTSPTTSLMPTSPTTTFLPTKRKTTITMTTETTTTTTTPRPSPSLAITTPPPPPTITTTLTTTNIQTTADVAISAPTTVANCYTGWINFKGLCYKITERKTKHHNVENSCGYDSRVAINIPYGLIENIGYDETVWINKAGNLQACDLSNVSKCSNSGSYHSLCSRMLINASITLSSPAKEFFQGFWLIPNTQKSFEIIKQHFSSCCASNGMWIGLYVSSGKFYWSDNTSVSQKEAEFLNISNLLSVNISRFSRKCAAYVGNITFISCSSRKMGIITGFPSPTPMDKCPCLCVPPRQNISAEEFQESLKEIVVNTKDTSKYKRSKISAADERTSSKAIGMVAIVFIVTPFAMLILLDIPTIVSQIKTTYKLIKNRSK